ncbi:fumarylacetoacetate hydrolase family protein [Streptomyces sp. NPDC055400]
MRLTTIRLTRDRTAAARIDKKHLTLLPHADVGALIASGPDWKRGAAAHSGGEQLPLHAATPAEPLLTATRVIRVGPNYPTRSRELRQERPQAPALRIVRPSRTAGAQATLSLPARFGQSLDWGVELGVVVARPAHRVPASEAFRCVAGYIVTAHVHDALLVGPVLLTADQLPPGARGLTLTSRLGDRLVQKANTSELHFDVATLVSEASAVTPLRPGDLLTTGTPGGTLDRPLGPGELLTLGIKGLDEIDIRLSGDRDPDESGRVGNLHAS